MKRTLILFVPVLTAAGLAYVRKNGKYVRRYMLCPMQRIPGRFQNPEFYKSFPPGLFTSLIWNPAKEDVNFAGGL